MLTLSLERDVSRRLAGFLCSSGAPVARSNHWQHFGSHNRVAVDEARSVATIEAGAGFDGTFELNFRGRSAREQLGLLWRGLRGRDEEQLHRRSFLALWPDGEARLAQAARVLGEPMTPQKVLACHYLALLEPHLERTPPKRCLEIGAGAGYLAALVHARYRTTVAIVDLPEILPLAFLYLHAKFPGARYVLANEENRPGAEFLFLTPDKAEALESTAFDLAVNTASFGEMLPAQVAAYFAQLRRVLRPEGLFFTVNREEKWMNDPSVPIEQNLPGHGIAVRFDAYPWSERDRDLLHEPSAIHARVQPQNPMRARLCHLAAK